MGVLGDRRLDIANAVFSLLLGNAALGAATLHLGRPKYAFRAFLGLKTSWMSREIIAFSLFAGLSTAYAAAFFVPQISAGLRTAIGYATGVSGILGVYCSVMIYAVTKRPHWRGSVTGFKFSFTSVVLGAATVLMISAGTTLWLRAPDAGAAAPAFVSTGAFTILTVVLVLSALVKLTSDASVLVHLRDTHHSGLKRAALLMVGDLGVFTKTRFICGALGGLVLPALGLVAVRSSAATDAPFPYLLLTVIAAASFGLSLVGELIERMLFFAAAPSSKMPGGIN
jgi:DMSO reductase anchor subunit